MQNVHAAILGLLYTLGDCWQAGIDAPGYGANFLKLLTQIV
jgi:hypothetical protein